MEPENEFANIKPTIYLFKWQFSIQWNQSSVNDKRCYVMTSDFRQYIAESTVANFWRYPIRRRVIVANVLELLLHFFLVQFIGCFVDCGTLPRNLYYHLVLWALCVYLHVLAVYFVFWRFNSFDWALTLCDIPEAITKGEGTHNVCTSQT